MADETQGGATADDATQTQAQNPNQTQNQAVEKKPAEAAQQPPPIDEQRLTLTVAEYRANQEQIRELQAYKAAEAEREEKRNQEKLKAQAEKEGFDKALQTQREQLRVKEKEWEGKYLSLQKAIGDEKIEAAINDAVSGLQFIGKTPEVRAAAAQDFRTLLKASAGLAASQDADGKWTIRDANGRDAKDALAEIVKAKSYLIASDTQGGVRNGGGAADMDRQGVDENNEYVRQHRQWQAANQAQQAVGLFPLSSRN